MSRKNETYIDGFVLPITETNLSQYKDVAIQVAEIWKNYGATAYFEFVGDDMKLEGTRSFTEIVDLKDGEVVVFGWVVFPSKEIRDDANRKVPNDPKMTEIVAPLLDPKRIIFNAERMIYGGFKALVAFE